MRAERFDEGVEIKRSPCPRKLPTAFFFTPVDQSVYSATASSVPEIVSRQLVFETFAQLTSRPIVSDFQFDRNRSIKTHPVKAEVRFLVIRKLLLLRNRVASERLNHGGNAVVSLFEIILEIEHA